MKLVKYFILFANIVSGATLIPYSDLALFLWVIWHDSSRTDSLFLPMLLILSIYPLGVIGSIYYSNRIYLKNKNIIAVCIAYIPVFIALCIYLIRFMNHV